MKAVRYHGVEDIRIEELEKPIIKADEALVRIAYAGICGSDLHIYRKGMFILNPPQIMGHEFSGIVEEVGALVTNVKPGERVTGDPRLFCHKCHWCLEGKGNLCSDLGFIGELAPGSFSEFMAIKADKLLNLPDNVDLIIGCLAEPVAVGLHIAEKGYFAENKTVGIIGAGPIGLITALLAENIFNTHKVTLFETDEKRLLLAKALGIKKAYKASPEPELFDVVIEAAGSETAIYAALEKASPEGTVVLAGIYEENILCDLNPIIAKQLIVTGIHGYQIEHIRKAISTLSEGNLKLDSMIEIMPLYKARESFNLLLDKEKVFGKILLAPSWGPDSKDLM